MVGVGILAADAVEVCNDNDNIAEATSWSTILILASYQMFRASDLFITPTERS